MTEAATFNTPLEAGLRSLFVLAAGGRRAFDVQRLVYFDYLLVHSGQFGGPESLHPRTPSQKGELLVRRRLVQEGVRLMRSRDLVERRFLASGIGYYATPAGRHVVAQFESDYASRLSENAVWVVLSFVDRSDERLAELLTARAPAWEDEIIEVRPGGNEERR